MKDSFNRHSEEGFSVIEIIIALALLVIVLTGVLSAQFMADYWTLSSRLSSEALSLGVTEMSKLEQVTKQDFMMTSSSAQLLLQDATNPLLDSCLIGQMCYWKQMNVSDISLCAKSLEVSILWKAGLRYPTSSVSEARTMVSPSEVLKRGGDCVLDPFLNTWSQLAPIKQISTTTSPSFTTGLDVLDDRVYVVASSLPMFRIYRYSNNGSPTLQLMSASSVLGKRLNAIDVIRDAASGRRYAYVTEHTTTNQLVVLDVTNDTITVAATRSLFSTDSAGSFPQGWRIVAYGSRLYVTARETAGAELHIFSIVNPTNPIEVTSGAVNLARTVNDMAIQDRLVGGVVRRYLFLAASASLKELGIYEVTNDVPIERVALDAPGTENALSVFVNGDTAYFGRQQMATGPELSQYSVSALLAGNTVPLAQSEVGADVSTIRATGDFLFLGTSKSGSELQIWRSGAAKWNASIVNAARISAVAATRLAPLGLDMGSGVLFTTAQSFTQPEQLSVWANP